MAVRQETGLGQFPKQKTEREKGFLSTVQGRVAAGIVAGTIAFGSFAVYEAQNSNEPGPTPIPGGIIEPSNSSIPTPFLTENPTITIPPSPEVSPSPTPSVEPTPTPTPTETPVPAIEKVPVSEIAKSLGNLHMFPRDSAPGFWLEEQHPQIIAKIRSGDSLLLATIIGNNKGKLQKNPAGEFFYNGKLITLYNYKNLVIWYKLGPKAMLMVRNGIDSSSGETEIGIGIDAIDKSLSVGDDLFSINTSVSGKENIFITSKQSKNNAATFNKINASVGQSVSYDQKFVLYPSIIVLPYGTK